MHYNLIVETPQENFVKLRLENEHGQFMAHQEIRMSDHPASYWEGVFDTRRHVDRYEGSLLWENAAKPETEEQIVSRLGLFVGKQVLGEAIFRKLTESNVRRTLVVTLPLTSENLLAAAFARIPWEIARLSPDEPALMEKNLVVRVMTAEAKSDPAVLDSAKKDFAKGDHLRVLMVFAEAPGSRPLAMRLEREQLLNLFYNDIFPRKRVQADVLCHGVTLSVLRERISAANGYHIVHWSGHGHHNLLEIQGENGEKNYISGKELVTLFQESGGFIPQIVFLSACLSGTFVDIHDWNSFHAAVTGRRSHAGAWEREDGGKEAQSPVLPEILTNPAGYTGTALELLKTGVPQVIAMRYEVGDDYARDLARQFFKRLLADPGKHSTEGALALARSDLFTDRKLAARLGAVNHATPLMFGREGRILEPAEEESDQTDSFFPQPQPLLPGGSHELDTPENFVGRSEELTQLNTRWLPDGAPAVALIQGLAGMGKTVMAAEAVHLWHSRFRCVLAFQAKPSMLMTEEVFLQIDGKLLQYSSLYQKKCEKKPGLSVYLAPNQRMSAKERYDQMRYNLFDALRKEAILIVLDNFETNLSHIPLLRGDKGVCQKGGTDTPPAPSQEGIFQHSHIRGDKGVCQTDGCFSCIDPQWDELLGFLAQELKGTRSRILITSRHMPAVLSGNDGVLPILLGPLAFAERGLYIRSHPKLRELMFSDKEGEELARSLLTISRGHPLIMNRLAALADNRKALAEAMDAIKNKGFATLPDLFAPMSEKDREKERAYLEDAAIGSVDFLIERVSADARHLLWMITQANEPVSEDLIQGVWSGKSVENEQMEQLRSLLQFAEKMPEEIRKQIAEKIPPEILQLLQSPANAPDVPDIEPLLGELTRSGLISRESKAGFQSVSSDDAGKIPALQYSFHELVRERMTAWMDSHETERGGKTPELIWVAYGERYKAIFDQLEQSAKEQANEAGRRALVYFVRAKAFDKLGVLASALVTGTNDPALLGGVIAELQAIADQVPAGKDRWSLRTNLAGALEASGHPDQSLPFYEQACAEAEAAENWSDMGVICGNWANALGDVGQLDKSKEIHLRSAEAYKKTGGPKIKIYGRELEALRIDVYQGKVREVLPEIESLLKEIRDWYHRSRKGEAVPEAPEPVFLSRALISGLDIAEDANLQIENWEACLSLLKETEQTQQENGAGRQELFRTRFNQYGPLRNLGRLDEAQSVLGECLAVFREVNDLGMQVKVLGSLASIWDERGDMGQAIALAKQALAICNQLPDPADRAISHGNLSNYLNKAGKIEDEARHVLADILYLLITTRLDRLATCLNNLKIRMNRAAQSGSRYDLPRIAALLSLPEFEALHHFLQHRQVDMGQLQETVDQMVEMVRG